MAQILVSPEGVSSLRSTVQTARRQNSSNAGALSSILSQLDFEASSAEEIKRQIRTLQSRLTQQTDKMECYARMLQQVSDQFVSADKRISKEADAIRYAPVVSSAVLERLKETIEVDIVPPLEIQHVDEIWTKIGSLFPGAMIGGGVAGFSLFGSMMGTLSGASADANSLSNTQRASLWNASLSTPTDKINVSMFGYEADDDEFSGHLLKVSGESEVGLGNLGKAATATSVAVGVVRSSSSIDSILLSSDREHKIGQTETSADSLKFNIASEVGVTGAILDYETTIGTDQLSGTVDANVKLLDADVGFKAGVGFDEDGKLSAVVKGEVGASVAEVEANGSVKVGETEVKATVSAEVGVGVYGELGYDAESREIEIGFGASLGIGGKIKFSIKVPDLGLPWW